MYKPIRDYAIIGNLRSAALVGNDGSIDWAPAPFIDSPSVFSALLDDKIGGFWKIAPKQKHKSTQHYITDTNILVTRFETNSGVLEVTDFIPIEHEKTFLPAEEDTTFRMHRRVECTEGEVEVGLEFCPRFNYALDKTWLSLTDGGVLVEDSGRRAVLASEHCTFDIEDDCAYSTFSLKKGDLRFFVFRYNRGSVEFRVDDRTHHEEELAETTRFWNDWISRCELPYCELDGEWDTLIKRSLLVLKILFFEPVGTVAAAPTTSLPEAIGGIRNWDYRYTWLRDSAFVFEAFFRAGHVTEAEEYINWIVSQCYSAEHPEDLQIMYGLRGERNLDEHILTHLKGYRESTPVRVGNDAYRQKQWDIYGSVMNVVWKLHEIKNEAPSEHRWNMLRSIAEYVTTIWDKPDEGLWEVRGGARDFVYSKVMCWVALDRALRFAKKYKLSGKQEHWHQIKDAIYKEVMTRGYNKDLGAFTLAFDSDDLDAASLLFPMVGFIEGDDPKMRSTIDAIKAHLVRDHSLLLRYTIEDGLPGREGAFLLASFWLVEALVMAKQVDEAREVFESVVARANHVGLFSEEMNPKTDEMLGNFPQAYTHIGLINSAMMLRQTLHTKHKS